MDFKDTSINCKRCKMPTDPETGFCDYCGLTLTEGQECPYCGAKDLYEASIGYCHNCGYNGIEAVYKSLQNNNGEELLPLELDEPVRWTEPDYKPYQSYKNVTPIYTICKPEPYQPFFDMIEDLKKWHVKVEKTTKAGLNGWLSRQTSKVVGVDVTHMAKAFGPRIWIPEYQWGTKQGYISLSHEAEHAKDFWKFGVIPFFLMQYILPFGPSFTALLEYRAYVAGFRAEKRVYGSLLPNTTERVAKAMASRGYKYCWPWWKIMKKWLDKAIA